MMRPTITLPSALLAGALALAGTAHAGVLDDVKAATTPGSPGGETVTPAELDALVLAADAAGADDAIAATVAAGAARARGAFAEDGAYGRLLVALRRRVAGLAPASAQAPGVRFTREPDGGLVVGFDRQGVRYARVDIVYTFDWWTTTRAATLAEAAPGRLAASLDAPPEEGAIVYALHVFGVDGRNFWIANGRENGVYGGPLALDHSFPLWALGARPVAASAPPLAQLVRRFATVDSPDGEVVSMGDFSLLVEQLTFEGGPGLQDPAQLAAATAAIDELVAAGVVFDAGIEDGLRGFLDRQRLATATYPSAAFARGTDGQLLMTLAEGDAVAATVIYTTDGWRSPKVAWCAGLVCDLGAIPPGTLASYVVHVRDAAGRERWIGSVLGNFFHALP